MKNKIVIVIGTRPELIKLAPVILEFKKQFKKKAPVVILNTAQHKDLLEPYWKIFNIKPDFDLDFMKQGQSLSELTSRGILQFEKFIDDYCKSGKHISGILAQGDTTTVMVSSMVAFYKNIPFYHLEAGLRTNDLQNPFPEEFNRKVASISAQLHFAPTIISKNNLLNEGVTQKIIVTGNTIVDAVEYFKKKLKTYNLKNKKIATFIHSKPQNDIILITCHRRENHGKGLLEIIAAVKDLSVKYKEKQFIWPLHPNPNVCNVIKNNISEDFKNIHLVEPLEYFDLLYVLSKSKLVLTDSGGIQEEAPSFNVPVLILRNKTERPEGINAGIAKLVGTKKEKIIYNATKFLKIKLKNIKNPYGNGKAAKKVVSSIIQYSSIN